MERLVGLRPSGELHLGHYFSVIRPAQNFGAKVLIATLHAPGHEGGTPYIKSTLRRFGILDNQMIVQDEVFDAQLYFNLLALTHIGELQRMIQYRVTFTKDRNPHLLTYPVLMTHDVTGYDEVVVGQDQMQHLNFARDLLARYNKHFNATEKIPTANFSGGKVYDLKAPNVKMSKSMPDGCLFLNDSADSVNKKIRKAITNDRGLGNLVHLYQQLGGEDSHKLVAHSNERFKKALAERIIELIGAK